MPRSLFIMKSMRSPISGWLQRTRQNGREMLLEACPSDAQNFAEAFDAHVVAHEDAMGLPILDYVTHDVEDDAVLRILLTFQDGHLVVPTSKHVASFCIVQNPCCARRCAAWARKPHLVPIAPIRRQAEVSVCLLFHEFVEGTSQRCLLLRWRTWGLSISVAWQLICIRGILWQTITMICGFHDSSGI